MQSGPMTGQLRLIELSNQRDARETRKLDHQTRNIGRIGIAAARAALATAKHFPEVDLDAA
ncbi:MAG TPA: hypothetical protein DEB44_02370 [Acidimicrobiaceae bacterium]|nr:hypothetical protein [Acidimicrobiaceae bacterium]